MCLLVQPAAIAQSSGATDDLSREELIGLIRDLQRRVEDLESNAVLSEPETYVREVEVYVDESGVEYDEPQVGARPVVTYERERVYRRQTINEAIEAALDDAASNSVEVGVDAAVIVQSAHQTSGPDGGADGNFYQLASADLYFTAGLAQNTIFFADVVGLSGTPPDGEINGLTLVNGYTARLVEQNDISLREAWLHTELFDQQLSLTAGRVDLTNYFDNNAVANDETSQFLSDALVNNPMLGLSENGAGVAAVYDPKNGFTARAGYQQSSSMATNLSDSLFYLGELGYLWSPFGLGEGNYRAWFRTDNSSGGDRDGYGVSIDQRITPSITLFGRYGSAQADVDRDEFYSAGFEFRNGFVLNPEDAWGVGYARTSLDAGDEEGLVEGYYKFHLTQKLALAAHLTHVTEEPMGGDDVSYLVPGLRLQTGF